MAKSVGGRESKKAKKNVHFLVRLQHVEGLLITISIFYFGYFYLQPFIIPPTTNDLGTKLRFVLGCSVVPSLVFLWSIVAVMVKRRKLGIGNPLTGREHLLELEHRFSQNTLEQLTVFLVSTVVLATYLEGDEMKLVPLNALVFTAGRILFRVGCGVHPKYRGVGVWCGFSAQFIILSLCAYMIYTRGIMYGLRVQTYTTAATQSISKEEL